MSGCVGLEVIAAGAGASLQDAGRPGWRRFGVPWSGALDSRLMRIANRLAGQPDDAAVIECFDGGLQLAARGGAVRLALAGHAACERGVPGRWQPVAAWRSLTLEAGEALRVRRMSHGRIAMLAVHGLAVPHVLGSASTYARAGLGGLDGKPLAPGMLLPVAGVPAEPERILAVPPAPRQHVVRVVAGPQAGYFTNEALAQLACAAFQVSTAADRMGVRLIGPPLAHAGVTEIVSDATVPGSIQVPGNGQPIVLLADAQTAGGYPKIATVISADLACVAQCPPGGVLRFRFASAAEGALAACAAEAETQALLAAVRPFWSGGVDLAALHAQNLVSGVVDARWPDAP